MATTTSLVSGSNWAWLPKHVLDMVLKKLVIFSDYARFSAVCVPWHCIAMENRKQFVKKLNCQVPLLLISRKDQEKGQLKKFYNVTTKKFVNLEVRLPFNTRYAGSSRGWLITVGKDFAVTLINPISSAEVIRLPPILKSKTAHFIQIHKAILSADPYTEPHDYEVVAIYGERSQLAFIKPGKQDADWTYMDEIQTVFDDIIYHEGRLHAVDYTSKVFSFDDKLSFRCELTPAPMHFLHGKTYLVETLGGDLLLICRHFKFFYDIPKYRKTKQFKVYKWNPSGPIWVQMKSLGAESLFLGDNMSTSILASEFPGCSPNSIYFTHDFDDILVFGDRGPIDSGVFNLENSSKAPHYEDEVSLIAMAKQPPIWFVPNFLSATSFPIEMGCYSSE